MKRTVLLLLRLFSLALGQYVAEYSTEYLFGFSGYTLETRPSFSVNAPSYKFLKTTTAADTVTSIDFIIQKGGGDIALYARRDPITGSTVTTRLEILLWRAPGFPDSTGYEVKTLATFTGTGTARVTLADSSWWVNQPVSRFKLRIVETGATQNYWMVDIKHYKESY